PDPLSSIGITPYMPNIPLVIGKVASGSPAATAGMQLNDKILAINNQPIKQWDSIITAIQTHPDETLNFTLERNHKEITLPVHIGHQRNIFLQKSGYLGIGPDFTTPAELLRVI